MMLGSVSLSVLANKHGQCSIPFLKIKLEQRRAFTRSLYGQSDLSKIVCSISVQSTRVAEWVDAECLQLKHIPVDADAECLQLKHPPVEADAECQQLKHPPSTFQAG